MSTGCPGDDEMTMGKRSRRLETESHSKKRAVACFGDRNREHFLLLYQCDTKPGNLEGQPYLKANAGL